MTRWQQQLQYWMNAACRMEVLSPKPGNVCPGKEFDNASVRDFLHSAAAIAPVIALAQEQSLGQTILNAVRATRAVVNHNTNLGIILLTTPLAMVPPEQSLIEGVERVLAATTLQDSSLVYEAIRLASPGGLGDAGEEDVASQPTRTLRDCMALAADRDLIAAQYANGFQQILENGMLWLRDSAEITRSQPEQITWLALKLLASFGDTLIVRKCDTATSARAQTLAADVLQTGWPQSPEGQNSLLVLDEFLRADGNRRNPGTTADCVAAILFAAQREGWYTMNPAEFSFADE